MAAQSLVHFVIVLGNCAGKNLGPKSGSQKCCPKLHAEAKVLKKVPKRVLKIPRRHKRVPFRVPEISRRGQRGSKMGENGFQKSRGVIFKVGCKNAFRKGSLVSRGRLRA